MIISNRDAAIRRKFDALCMVKIKVELLTGKEAIELVGKRERPPDGEDAPLIYVTEL